MRLKEQGKNSILLLSRSSVIAGAVLIAVVSIGLGYFIGFKTGQSTVNESEQIVERPLRPPEEKRVLEPLKPTNTEPPQIALQPPDKAEPHQDKTVTDKLNQSDTKEIKPTVEIEKNTKQDDKQQSPKQAQADVQHKGFEKQLSTPKTPEQGLTKEQQKAQRGEPTNVERLPAPEEKKPAAQRSKQRLYTIQFGAFPNRKGAEELQSQLKAKAINAYIVDKDEKNIYYRVRVGSFSSKKEAETRALSIEKQTGLKGFITTR